MKIKLWSIGRTAKNAAPERKEGWMSSIIFAVVAATLIRWTAVEAFVGTAPRSDDIAMLTLRRVA